MKPAAAQKFDALTGARCVFACLVFIYHNRKYWRNDLNKYVLQLTNEMHIGVSLFFVLSGFLIAYKYNDPGKRNQFQYGRYIGLRFARILPLYWLVLLVSYIDWGFPGTYKTVLTFTLAHGFADMRNLDGIAQAWSLTVELSFYLLAPLIFVWWNKKITKAVLYWLLMLAAVTAIGYAWHKINGNKDEFFYPFQFIIHSTFFGRFPEFAAGIYLAAILHNAVPNPFAKLPFKTWIGVGGMFISLFIISFFQPDIFHHGNDTVAGALLQYSLIPFFAIIWLYGLITEQTWMSRLLSTKLMVLLGNASFAFYLIHISYVNLRLQDWRLLPDRNFVLLWLIAIVMYLLFEKPVNDFCRKLLRPVQKIVEEQVS